jgi:phage/plasmid-associated DNA primase
MEEFLQILNEINMEEDTQDETQATDNNVHDMNDLYNENMSLKRSVRITVQHARLLRTSRAALKGKTKCIGHRHHMRPRPRTR